MNDPGCTVTKLLSRQQSIADHASNGRGTNGEGGACLIDRYFAAIGALAVAVRRYLVVMTQAADTVARPAVAAARRFPRMVQIGGNCSILHLTGENPHKIDDIGMFNSYKVRWLQPKVAPAR